MSEQMAEGTDGKGPDTGYMWQRWAVPRLPGLLQGLDAPMGYGLHSWQVVGQELIVCWEYDHGEVTLFTSEEEPLHVKAVRGG